MIPAQPRPTVIRVGDVAIGGDEPVLIAGPCSVETEARTLAIARAVKAAGARMFRAGAFKPRTNPYSFQGLGEEALHTLRLVREEVGLPVVSEVLDTESVDRMCEFVDVLQVGTRNMQNFSLLRKLASVRRPILLKRGMSATFAEWMMAAEYLLAGGNDQVILCERGVRGFDDHARNLLDLNVVPHVRRLSHLPILVDPSHGCGDRARVRAMARAALASGAHGLLIEGASSGRTCSGCLAHVSLQHDFWKTTGGLPVWDTGGSSIVTATEGDESTEKNGKCVLSGDKTECEESTTACCPKTRSR